VAANTGAAPTDLAVAPTGRSLWVLNSGSQTLSAFAIDPDGQLTLAGEAAGLPFGANGLAAN
jgi:DNA-binding beta-propeller fold protein YncE